MAHYGLRPKILIVRVRPRRLIAQALQDSTARKVLR
jgi:hypothetical protein